jgi:hypothetical protein
VSATVDPSLSLAGQTLTVNGTTETLDSQGDYTFTPTADGNLTLYATATDSIGQVGYDNDVNDVNAASTPSGNVSPDITGPASGDSSEYQITSSNEFTGTVSTHAVSYRARSLVPQAPRSQRRSTCNFVTICSGCASPLRDESPGPRLRPSRLGCHS